jgi:hypothetical protein
MQMKAQVVLNLSTKCNRLVKKPLYIKKVEIWSGASLTRTGNLVERKKGKSKIFVKFFFLLFSQILSRVVSTST